MQIFFQVYFREYIFIFNGKIAYLKTGAAEQGGHRGTVPPLPLQISWMTPKSAPKVPLNSPRVWKFWLPTVDFKILLQLHIEQICPYLC